MARRAMALRRFVNKSMQNAERIRTIMEAYRQRGEPGVHIDEDQLKEKKMGDPATVERAETNAQPKGQ